MFLPTVLPNSCALGELDSPPRSTQRLSSRLIYAVQIHTVCFLQEINPLQNYIALIPRHREKGETWQKSNKSYERRF